MKKVLIVATTSYAGMGPYVSGIVNTFLPNDDVYYFFHDYDDLFFRKNVKEELHSRSFISWLILYGISYMTLSLDIGSMKRIY